MRRVLSVVIAVLCGLLLQSGLSWADSVFLVPTANADAFLAAGSPSNPVCTDCSGLNFGGAGTLAISPASSPKGEFDSVVQWNTTGATAQFNTAFGTGNWQITSIALNLASNFGVGGVQPNNGIFNLINAGNFNIQWISNNSWVEGTGGGMGSPGFPTNSNVSFQSIPTLLSGTTALLGTFTYTPPGNNVYVQYNLPLNSNLVSNVVAGGLLSLYFSAADDQVGYLFNSKTFAGNSPQFIITAAPVPVPAAIWLFGSGLAAMIGCTRRRAARVAP